MRTSSQEHEPGVEQGRNGIWGNLVILVSFIKWLVDNFYPQLTDAEREEAGIHVEHQGMDECWQTIERPQIAVTNSYEGEKK